MRILAIDPGSNFGFSLFVDGELRAANDFENYVREQEYYGADQGQALSYLFAEYRPQVLVVEDVVKGSTTMRSWQAVWHTVGVEYSAVSKAHLHGSEVALVPQQTLKKYLREQLDLPARSKVSKRQIVEYVNGRYRSVSLKQKHHNIADAIALGECYLERQAS